MNEIVLVLLFYEPPPNNNNDYVISRDNIAFHKSKIAGVFDKVLFFIQSQVRSSDQWEASVQIKSNYLPFYSVTAVVHIKIDIFSQIAPHIKCTFLSKLVFSGWGSEE